MKISEITESEIAEYLRLDPGTVPNVLGPIRKAAAEYIKSYTGMDDAQIDAHEEFYAVFMVLAQDMYDNRSFTVNNANVNKVVESILGLHRTNLL